MPEAGITTVRLVAPGATSPTSIDPSLNTTWCVMLSLFLKTTGCPPNAAGFGVKKGEVCPVMVMVAGVPDGLEPVVEGAVAVDPPPVHATVAPNAPANIQTQSFLTVMPSAGASGIPDGERGDAARMPGFARGLCAAHR